MIPAALVAFAIGFTLGRIVQRWNDREECKLDRLALALEFLRAQRGRP